MASPWDYVDQSGFGNTARSLMNRAPAQDDSEDILPVYNPPLHERVIRRNSPSPENKGKLNELLPLVIKMTQDYMDKPDYSVMKPEDWQKQNELYQQEPYLQKQNAAIEGMRGAIENYKNQESKRNLKPVAAFLDSLTGGHTAEGISAPETEAEKQQMLATLQGHLGGAYSKQEEDRLKFIKETLLPKKSLDLGGMTTAMALLAKPTETQTEHFRDPTPAKPYDASGLIKSKEYQQALAIRDFNDALNNYQKTLDEVGGGEIVGEKATKLQAAHSAVIEAKKNLGNYGSNFSRNEELLINNQMPGAAGVEGYLNWKIKGKKGIYDALQNLRTQNKTRFDKLMNSTLRPAYPKGGAQLDELNKSFGSYSAPSAAPPVGKKVPSQAEIDAMSPADLKKYLGQ